jgi:anaerobic selenocysteine-containing dehydrogenase
MSNVTRRTFLKSASVAALVGGIASCQIEERLEEGWPEEYEVEKPPVPGAAEWSVGEERHYNSICLQCPGGCGIQVKVVEGRAVKIEGNPIYPINLGGLCPKGQNGLQVLYDPDRIKGPMKRVGKRGEGKWQSISWEQAIKEVGTHLKTLRKREKPHTLAVLGGHYRGHMGPLMDRFLKVYGSPNNISHDLGIDGSKAAVYFMQGIKDNLTYDWENTNYILCFGTSLLEAGVPAAYRLRMYGQMRRGRSGQRAKIVQIDIRCSISATKADEWIKVKPGSDGALALGIAHVIIRDRLYDHNFVNHYTFGFEDWQDNIGKEHIGFKRLVMEQYSPEKVSDITGVSGEVIERVAHEFVSHRPAIALSGRGVSGQSNGVYACMAIHALNALIGSIDIPGGVMVQRRPPFKDWWEPTLDRTARKGLSQPRIDLAGSENFPFATSAYATLPNNILTETPYKLDTLFLYYTNPLFSSAQISKFYEVFNKVPFIVSFSPFLDESTQMADLILPDHTYLERWEDDEIPSSVGYPLVGIRQPVVKPLYNTRHSGDVLIAIAKVIGGSVGASFLDSYQDMVRDAFEGIRTAGIGSIQEKDPQKFWTTLLNKGGWWAPPYPFGQWQKVVNTPSGRFEFFSLLMQSKVEELKQKVSTSKGITEEKAFHQLVEKWQLSARGDEVFMAHYEPLKLVGDTREYPFLVNTYKVMPHAEGRGGNQPHLQEIFGLQHGKSWEPWIEISPEDAHRLGIADEDWVWVESPIGRVRFKALIFEGVQPGILNVPFEYGHRAYGRWAVNRGENLNQIIGIEFNYLNGNISWGSTQVRVIKA